MATRKSAATLCDAEVTKIQDALVALKREVNSLDGRSTYDRYVLTHQRAMDRLTLGANDNPAFARRNSAHRGPSFLPWHREFIARFERDVQRVAEDATLGLPYWDWTPDAIAVAEALASESPQPALSIERLVGPPGTPFMVINRTLYFVTSGPFGFDVDDQQNPDNWFAINDRGHLVQPLERRYTLAWQQFEGQRPTLPTTDDVAGAVLVEAYDNAPWDESSQDSFRNILEGFQGPGLHNIVHRWVGGSMLPGTSPNDPIFFLHHCNIDRIWAAWQVGKSTDDYQPQTGGPCGHNLNDPMYPWNGQDSVDVVTPADVWDYRNDMEYEYDALP